MAYTFPKLELVRDNLIRIHHPEPIEPRTHLTASVAAAGVTLTVANNAGFSNTDPQTNLLFEELGNPLAEIKRVNGAITAGTSLTTQAVTFAHAINTPISRILFDRVEVSGAATLTGVKTVIDTVDINVQDRYTDFVVTGTTYAFYFARFRNSLATTPYFGDYSDGVASTGFTPSTVGFVRRVAFKNVGEDYGKRWDSIWVYDQIYLCELDVLKEKDKVGQLIELDADLGDVSTGQRSVAMPADIEDTQTNKSILGLRIGKRENMTYVDRPTFEDIMRDVAFTTTAAEIAVSATSVTLTDSNDFDSSGSINIAGTSYSYTANNRTTNVLSGFATTAFTAIIASGTNVWQGITFGEPRRYTVNDGTIFFDVPPSSDYVDRNLWIDYYKTAVRPNSDGDTVTFTDPLLYIYWLEMAVKREKANGDLAPTDASVLAYNRHKALFIAKDQNPAMLRFVPDVPAQSLGRRARIFF